MKIECIWEHNGSDVIFKTEEAPFTYSEYCELKELALKSAADFLRLYESMLTMRETFWSAAGEALSCWKGCRDFPTI